MTYATIELCVGDIFKDVYRIPEFHREYGWTGERIQSFMSSICCAFHREEDLLLGQIITWQENGFQMIIDGQQRITTLYLLLIALRNVLPPQRGGSYLEGQIWGAKLDYRTGEEEIAPRLRLANEAAARELNNLVAGVPSTPARKSSAASGAFRQLGKSIDQEFGRDVDRLRAFSGFLNKRVFLVRTVCHNARFANRLFEICNLHTQSSRTEQRQLLG
jgi:hypothetical protein